MVVWSAPAPQPVDGPVTGPERPMLEGYLDWHRSTLLNICADLSARQLAQRPLPSTDLSLLGLVRHLAKVERIWFRIRLAGEDVESLFVLGTDDDFALGTVDDAADALITLVAEQDAARAAAAAASLEQLVPTRDEPMSLRMTYLHVIGEYARHNGHADLLRQAIDGVIAR